MAEGLIEFFCEDVEFELPEESLVAEWILQTARRFKKEVEFLTVVFCSDEFLLDMNRRHLDHDYYTDIITFPYHEPGSAVLTGDLFISLDRVRENAESLGLIFIDELHRVIIHGVLHLIGFEDGSVEDKEEMRHQEDYSLALRMF